MNIHFPAIRFEPHRARLLALARGWLGNHADAQDAVQDTWLRAQSAAPPALDSDAAWLVTVLRHLCVDRLRRRQLESRELQVIDHDLAEPSAEHLATQSLDTQAALRRIASVLPADDLAALLLHAVFDFEHGEIARWAGQTEAAMRQRVHRALRRARSRLAGRDDVDADHDADHDDPAAARSREALFSLCWRALHRRDAAGLIAQVRQVPVSTMPVASAALAATIGDIAGAAGGAPRSASQVVQVDGAFALAWVLDGVVLCTVPMGPLAAGREACAGVDA